MALDHCCLSLTSHVWDHLTYPYTCSSCLIVTNKSFEMVWWCKRLRLASCPSNDQFLPLKNTLPLVHFGGSFLNTANVAIHLGITISSTTKSEQSWTCCNASIPSLATITFKPLPFRVCDQLSDCLPQPKLFITVNLFCFFWFKPIGTATIIDLKNV